MPTNRRVLMHASRLAAWAAILPLIAGPAADASAGSQTPSLNWSNIRVLLYTKNGTGYVHDNIPASIEAIRTWPGSTSSRWMRRPTPPFSPTRHLKRYNALIFSNTNNVVFDTDAQRVALMRYVQAGGGFAAIHSASGSERTWKWFAGLLGGTFSRHAPIQKFAVRILDRSHPSVAHLPERWERDDECYYLVRMNMNLRVLAANELTAIRDPKEAPPATFGDLFPSVWYQEFDGGRQWYTSLGHRKEDYAQPEFRRHLLGGIQSVVRDAPRDYTRAYAVTPADEPRRR